MSQSDLFYATTVIPFIAAIGNNPNTLLNYEKVKF